MEPGFELKNIDADDLEDLLVMIERSFNIKFAQNELAYVTNFGQLCDHIINKIQLEDTGGCTSQQAFYKLQTAFADTLKVEKNKITPKSILTEILPRKGRIQTVAQLERNLGFKINILQPPNWVIVVLIVGLPVFPILIFASWKIGVFGFCLCLIGTTLASKFGKEFDLETVGQVAERMSRKNYLKSRRNPTTINRGEIEKLLTSWFKNDLALDKLDRTSTLK